MKTFFISYGRFFVLAFLLGFLFPHLNPDFLKSSSTDYDKYLAIETMDEMILTFHKDMNETTNAYLEQMFSSEEPNVLYPGSDSDCGSDNLSSYCLAFVLNEKLVAFEQALTARRNDLSELYSSVEGSDSDQLDTLTDAIQFSNQQNLVVEEQMQNAEDALDLTLAVYNQVQVVYPLHTELTTFRKNLEDLRDKLALVRDSIELYPSEFNGASTAQCK